MLACGNSYDKFKNMFWHNLGVIYLLPVTEANLHGLFTRDSIPSDFFSVFVTISKTIIY